MITGAEKELQKIEAKQKLKLLKYKLAWPVPIVRYMGTSVCII